MKNLTDQRELAKLRRLAVRKGPAADQRGECPRCPYMLADENNVAVAGMNEELQTLDDVKMALS